VIPLELNAIEALGLGRLERMGPIHVSGVQVDSRRIQPGDLFVVVGEGGQYVDDARERRAAAAGRSAHQRDRLMTGLLHPIEHHDRQQRADVKRRRGAVEADIGGDRRGARGARPRSG